MAQRYQRRDASSYNRYYTHGSAARQVEDLPEERPHPPIRRGRPKTLVFADIQDKLRHHFLSYLILVAFFVGLAVILALNVRLEYGRTAVNTAANELAALQNTNANRLAEIQAGLDLDAIYAFATEYLGMARAEEFQLVEIQVQHQSFFAHGEAQQELRRGTSFADFINAIFGFSGRE